MSLRQTETLHAQAEGLENRPAAEIAALAIEGQIAALAALRPHADAFVRCAAAMAESINSGGRLVYAAAGSSGLMGMADGLELPGTFGLAPSQIRIALAGGAASLEHMTGDTEDDTAAATKAAADLNARDCVIAISASGLTPWPLAWLEAAERVGSRRIAIVNSPDSPMARAAEIAICLETPAEIIAGSTRLGAGSAQKAALNTMSTLMGVMLGHVHDGMMVNVVADNKKLAGRARQIVESAAGCDALTAEEALAASGGVVKAAVLIAAGAGNLARAEELLVRTQGNLRAALAQI